MIGLVWVAACVLGGTADGFGVVRKMEVTVVLHPPSREERSSPERGYDCFGDETVRLEMDVLGTVGSSVDLVGQLFQLSAALAVPMGEPTKIVVARRFGDTARFHVSVPVHLPAVRNMSRFDFRIRGRSAEKPSWRSVGHQVLEVYPRGIMSELAQIGKTRLFVLDDHDARLVSFLKDEGIPYRVLSAAALSTSKSHDFADRTVSADRRTEDRLVLRVLSSKRDNPRVGVNDSILATLLRKGFRVIQFREKAGTVPAVFVRQVGPSLCVDIEVPLIDVLDASPRAQLFLLDVVRLALDDAQP